jgi:hypothetical protein
MNAREEELFDQYLDENGGVVRIAGIHLFPSQILKACDPIAYRCALTDYIDDLREYCDEESLREMGLIEEVTR